MKFKDFKKLKQKKVPKPHKYKATECILDDIKFASKTEGNYYIQLKFMLKAGKIKKFELQPVYIIQEKFKHEGKTIRAIKYIADFLVTYNDNSQVIIDVKGKATEKAKVIRKLFLKKFPDKKLLWIKHDKSLGWIDYFNYRNRSQKP